MRQDAWRAYLDMALGVTEASRKKALKAARKLVGKSGATAEQLQGLADELVRASAANREAVASMIRIELDRALGAVGLAKVEEVDALSAKVRALEEQLRATRGGEAAGTAVVESTEAAAAAARQLRDEARTAVAASPGASGTGAVDATSNAKPPAAKKAVARKTVAKTAVAKTAVAKPAVAKTAVAKPAVAKTAVAKTAVAKKAVVKKTVAKKTAVAKTAAAKNAAGTNQGKNTGDSATQ